MPFSNKRNSRDDNSRKSRGNSDSFKSRSDKNNSFGKKSYGSNDSSERGSFRKDDNRENRSFGSKKFSDRPSFQKDNNSSRSKDNSEKSFGRGSRPFDKNNSSRSFDKKDSFNKFDRSERSFDKKDNFKRNDRNDGPRSSNRKFDGERSRNFDDNKNFGEKQYIKRPKKKAAESEDDGLVRLNRYIANAGICSRRKADELITAGVIWVNGEPVTELGTKVDPATDEIRYNNERLKREKNVYVLLNKPKDYITTTDDPQERHTVMELVSKATKERIYPVGRLDRNTTGLLLMTNDGSLAEKLSHPRNSISKIYNVELNKSLTQGDFNKINFGIELEDGVIKPDDLSYVQGGSKREVGIQIHSGKNRIVRRIFESLGYEVVKLDRVVYANLTKKDLPRGRWRYLEEREIVQLKHLL